MHSNNGGADVTEMSLDEYISYMTVLLALEFDTTINAGSAYEAMLAYIETVEIIGPEHIEDLAKLLKRCRGTSSLVSH